MLNFDEDESEAVIKECPATRRDPWLNLREPRSTGASWRWPGRFSRRSVTIGDGEKGSEGEGAACRAEEAAAEAGGRSQELARHAGAAEQHLCPADLATARCGHDGGCEGQRQNGGSDCLSSMLAYRFPWCDGTKTKPGLSFLVTNEDRPDWDAKHSAWLRLHDKPVVDQDGVKVIESDESHPPPRRDQARQVAGGSSRLTGFGECRGADPPSGGDDEGREI